MTTIKVAIVGASGESGQSIVKALLESSTPKYKVTGLTRPQPIHKPVNTKLQERGVKVVPARLQQNPTETSAKLAFIATQLFYSWGIRGDNTPGNAEYLGYLNGKDLYPDFKYVAFEDYVKEVLDGKVKGVYQR